MVKDGRQPASFSVTQQTTARLGPTPVPRGPGPRRGAASRWGRTGPSRQRRIGEPVAARPCRGTGGCRGRRHAGPHVHAEVHGLEGDRVPDKNPDFGQQDAVDHAGDPSLREPGPQRRSSGRRSGTTGSLVCLVGISSHFTSRSTSRPPEPAGQDQEPERAGRGQRDQGRQLVAPGEFEHVRDQQHDHSGHEEQQAGQVLAPAGPARAGSWCGQPRQPHHLRLLRLLGRRPAAPSGYGRPGGGLGPSRSGPPSRSARPARPLGRAGRAYSRRATGSRAGSWPVRPTRPGVRHRTGRWPTDLGPGGVRRVVRVPALELPAGDGCIARGQ